MTKKRRKRIEDTNEIAHRVVAEATGEITVPVVEEKQKDPIAVELGRRGGLVGGRKRAENLSREELSKIGKLGARARWRKKL